MSLINHRIRAKLHIGTLYMGMIAGALLFKAL